MQKIIVNKLLLILVVQTYALLIFQHLQFNHNLIILNLVQVVLIAIGFTQIHSQLMYKMLNVV